MALARALAADPKVLLLDEPFGALDARVRTELRAWLRRLHEETHTTTVFVTHDQEEAMEIADRVVVMNRGRVEQVAAPQELYDEPANEFVMSFVGQANRFGAAWVRPHDLEVMLDAERHDAARRWSSRLVHLGHEVRGELVRDDGERLTIQLTRDRAERSSSSRRHRSSTCARRTPGVRPSCDPGRSVRGAQASGSAAAPATSAGSSPRATSASVTCSSTLRRLARTATHTSRSCAALPS